MILNRLLAASSTKADSFVLAILIFLTPLTVFTEANNGKRDKKDSSAQNLVLGEKGKEGKQWLVIELVLGEDLASQKLMIAWSPKTKDIYLPLNRVGNLVEFPIETNTKAKKANGWFLRRNRKLSLDFDKGKGRVQNRPISIEQKDWVIKYGDIYVAADLLEKILPLRFAFDRQSLLVRIEGTEPLPIEKKIRRKKRLEEMNVSSGEQSPQYPESQIPYQLLSLPTHDLYLDGQTPDPNRQNSELGTFAGEYRLHGTGDLLWMNGDWFVMGARSDALQRGRLTLSRRDPNGNMLGPASLTEIEVGDVSSPQVPAAGYAERGRGLFASSFPIRRPDSLGATTISGKLKTGWEVELYRNGQFLGVQEANSEGEYYFRNIELLFGWNEMKLVFFGPYGQKETEYEYYHIGPEMAQPGKGYTRVSVQQPNVGVLEFKNSPIDEDSDLHATGEYEYGLTESLSVLGGLSHIPNVRNGESSFGFVGARGYWGRLYTALDAVADIQNGQALRGHFNTRFGSINLVGEHLHTFGEFRNDQRPNLKTDTHLRINGNLGLPIQLPYTLEVEHLSFRTDKPSETDAQLRNSISLLGFHIRNELRGSLSSDRFQQIFGRSNLRVREPKWSYETGLNYDLRPVVALENWRNRFRWYISEKSTFKLRGNVAFRTPLIYAFESEIERRIWGMNVGLASGWESQRGLNIKTTISVGIGKTPETNYPEITSPYQTTRGAIYARAFWDYNNSGTFDKGDKPIKGAKFKVNGASRPGTTNKKGRIDLGRVQSYEYSSVEINPKSIAHPLALPTAEGRRIVARPGVTKVIEFPVVKAGEVDGYIYFRENNTKRKVGGACVEAYNPKTSEVVSQTTTAFDGFYYLTSLPPGNYIIRICPKYLKERSIKDESTQKIKIKADGTVIRGHNLTIRPQNPSSN